MGPNLGSLLFFVRKIPEGDASGMVVVLALINGNWLVNCRELFVLD